MAIILISLSIACGISFFINQSIGKSFMETSANQFNQQMQKQREDIKRYQSYYLMQLEITKFHPTFFYVQDKIDISNSIDKLIEYIFFGSIIIAVSLSCQILLFLHKNSEVYDELC